MHPDQQPPLTNNTASAAPMRCGHLAALFLLVQVSVELALLEDLFHERPITGLFVAGLPLLCWLTPGGRRRWRCVSASVLLCLALHLGAPLLVKAALTFMFWMFA